MELDSRCTLTSELKFNLLQSREFYLRRQHCDLQIQCQGQTGAILCHRFILSQISRWMKHYLESSKQLDCAVMLLPSSCKLESLKIFLDTLYDGLSRCSQDIVFPKECYEVGLCFNVQCDTSPDDDDVDDDVEKNVGESSDPIAEHEAKNNEHITFEISEQGEEEEADEGGDFGSEGWEFMESDTIEEPLATREAFEEELDSWTEQRAIEATSSLVPDKTTCIDLTVNYDSSLQKKMQNCGDYQAFHSYLTGSKSQRQDLPQALELKISFGKECCGLIENVRYFNPPYYKNMQLGKILTTIGVSHQIIVGTRSSPSEPNVILAKPLVWAGADKDTQVIQFNYYKEFVLWGLGISELDFLMQPLLMGNGLLFRSKKRNVFESLKAKYRREPENKHHEMQSISLGKLRYMESVKETTKKNEMSETRRYTFRLTGEMEASDCENVIFLALTEIGTFAFPVRSGHDKPIHIGKACIQALLDVWGNYELQSPDLQSYFSDQCLHAIEISQSVEAMKVVVETKEHLICDECGWKKLIVTDNDKKTFKRHVQKHTMEKEDCGCGLEFESVKSKLIHMQLKHSVVERAKCHSCDYISTKKSVARHIDFCHKIKNLVCDQCGTLCRKQADLTAHQRTWHKVFTCSVCDETFVGAPKLRKHKEKVHGKKKISSRPGMCEECNTKFKNKSELKKHILSVHTTS